LWFLSFFKRTETKADSLNPQKKAREKITQGSKLHAHGRGVENERSNGPRKRRPGVLGNCEPVGNLFFIFWERSETIVREKKSDA
jgi:hypothetical protein